MKTQIGFSGILFLLLFSGCQRLNSSADFSQIPNTFENPETMDSQTAPAPSTEVSESETPAAPPAEKPTTEEKKPSPIPETTRPISRLIYFAQQVMINEGKKLGTACNFFVHRVLQAAGFPYEVFRAGDFEEYAKKYFTHVKMVEFKSDRSGAEVERLRKHLWSYPERTPFITQWDRGGHTGHIALVERIGEKLVIFQASLGSQTPHRDQTTASILLNGYSRRSIRVYSEMESRK